MTAKGKNSDFPDKDTLKKYLQGRLSPEEAHNFEKHVLQDPFYQDALQGMESLDAGSFKQDMTDLSNRIRNRARTSKKAPVYFYRIAAAITLLAVFSYVIYITTSRIDGVSKKEVVTQKLEDSKEATAVADQPSDEELKPSEPIADVETEKAESEPAEPETDDRGETAALQEIQTSEPVSVTETVDEPVREDALVSRAALPAKDMQDKVGAGDEVSILDKESMEKDMLYEEVAQDLDMREEEEIMAVEEDTDSPELSRPERMEEEVVSEPAPMAMKDEEIMEVEESMRTDKQSAKPESRVAARKVSGEAPTMSSEELKPEPLIGFEAYSIYIKDNLQYPAEEAKNNIEGTVEVSFIIKNDSIPADFNIIQSLSENCDQEAIRLLKEGPKWKPVYVGDQLQEMEVNYTITFELKD